MQSPAMRPRPGGGFNPGMGQFNDHMDEKSMQSAIKQKALSQMAGAQTGPQGGANPLAGAGNPLTGNGAGGLPGMGGAGPGGFGIPGMDQTGNPDGSQPGGPSIFDTLITQPVQDLAKTFLEALHLDKLLGLNSSSSTPEEKAKKSAMHKRYQQLTEEQQAEARKRYQERLQRQKAEQQEQERKKQLEEQKRAQSFEMPSSPKKGPVGPDSGKSKKSNAIQKLQQDRKSLGGPQSAG